MPAHTLTLRLDEETNEALKERCEAEPKKPIADVIREAIAERGSCVYFVRRSDGAVKVGWSASLRTRLNRIRFDVGEVKLEAAMPGGRSEEAELHKQLASCRMKGPGREWFRGPAVEDVIGALVKIWGRPNADDWTAKRWKNIGIWLTPDEYAKLEAYVAKQNVDRRGPPTTIAWVLRQWIEDKLGLSGEQAVSPAVPIVERVPPEPASEPEVDDRNGSGHAGSDETTLRPALHGKRVRPAAIQEPSPVQETPVAAESPVPTSEGQPEATMGPPEPVGPPNDDDLIALLEGTPL